MRISDFPQGIGRAETVEFNFVINRSFLSAPSHPITVLKRYNPQLGRYLLSHRHEIVLCASNCKTLNAYIYYGVAGWGPYYQIRIPGRQYKVIGGDYYLDQDIEIELKLSGRGNITVFLKSPEELE